MDGFIAYATQGLVDQLREQLKVIRHQQWETTWQRYVYERFGQGSPTHLRRRRLVLELSKISENRGWIQMHDILDLLPRIGSQYANKTLKTLSRDLNAVAEMGLIEWEGRRVRAKKRLILAFLPARAIANSEVTLKEGGTEPPK
jgi:hypothetical protein